MQKADDNHPSGFTLIELLVVVLIIGILAAVALPQYQKSVEKSRAAQALAMLKSVYAAAEVYYLANGTWPNKFENLDAKISWVGKEHWTINSADVLSNGDWAIQIQKGGVNQGIQIGRLSGKYAGSGFVMWHNYYTNQVPLQKIVCAEQFNAENGIAFGGEDGDFCGKIIGGEFIHQASAFRYYKMPQ